MLKNTFYVISNQFIKNYLSWSPGKRKYINKLFFFVNASLRSYYTIPLKNQKFNSIGIKIFNQINKKFEVLDNAYLGKSIRDNVNSVSGYIPYLKDQTSIYLYHFFSINYGLRKTLIGQLSLIGENNQIKKSIVLKIPSRFNGSIKIVDYFKGIEGNSLVLEIHHPRIFNNHAGNQGHLRFWGVYGRDTSTVHSMPLFPFIVKNDTPRLADRRYYPHLENKFSTYFINCNLKNKSVHHDFQGDLSSSLKLLSGYTLQMEKNSSPQGEDYPSGIWHHSPFTRNNFLNHNEKIHSQIIAFPDIENIDALLFFGEYIVNNQEVDFGLYSPSQKKYLYKKKTTIEIDEQFQVSKLFPLKDLKGNALIITPSLNTGKNIFKHGYTNLQYLVKETICDGVHAHGYTSDSPGQGLKFMHYKIDEDVQSFFSIWGSRNNDINYRLRIIDSNNRYEKCINLKIEKEEVLQQINLNNLGIPNGEGIIQLECDMYNPAATSFIKKEINDKTFISVCHMTGG